MLTVITKPISRVYDILKWGQNIIKKIQGKPIKDSMYGGHFAVTRSVVEGLRKIGAEFNYNPKNLSKLGDTVYIPGGYQALKWAIKMKKKGKIKKLITGPNQVITPADNNGIIKSKYIDLFLVNSEWIKDFYIEDAPELGDHIDIWPAGVDTEFWKPNKESDIEKNVLIYYKRPIKKMFDECKKILENRGYNVEVIYYGKYTIEEYRESLNRNSFIVYLVEQESQGISLTEAWAMDTPTIVWNPGYYHNIDGVNYFSSSAPYLNSQTGKFFNGVKEFDELIKNELKKEEFLSRGWVLKNMSDEVCAQKLVLSIDKIK
ncbi:MAG TPA: hypothetical protein DEB09_02500 [Candidatus Magasanikbacteria bacterium]|nr:hypothetical protein [Candidatus Magasanikbacteria bacterium]